MEVKRHGLRLALWTLGAALAFSGCAEPRNEDPQQQTEQQQPSIVRARTPAAKEVVHVGGDEFTISGPYTHDNLDLFLIHSSDQRAPVRRIVTLEEAMKAKLVKVHETGQVQELAIENLTQDTDIYVQAGDIVRGGKQDRVLSVDMLLSAKSGKVPLSSFCVEQGRWSARGAAVGRPATALHFSSSLNAVSSKGLKRAVKLAKNQQEVWDNVAAEQRKLVQNAGQAAVSGVSASSLELTLSTKAVKEATTKYKKALGSIVEGKKDVVGYAFAINGKLNSAEIYANGVLFEKLWSKMLHATTVEAVSLAKEKKSDEPCSKDAVHAFLVMAENTKAEGRAVDGRTLMVTADMKSKIFTETRDKSARSAWLHRSYLAK